MRARKKDTGIVYALKIMDKKFITKENKTAYVKLERIVLDQLDHPGIVRLFFTFQDTFSLCRYSWLKSGQKFNILHSFCLQFSSCTMLSPMLVFLYHIWLFFYNLLYHLTWVPSVDFEDMALESCEGGELFDQITRVSSKTVEHIFILFLGKWKLPHQVSSCLFSKI